MPENNIGLKSIGELLEKNFYISCYQRGYRWERQQVEDLLEDIYSFDEKKGKNEKEFYCLQPVVVKKCSEEFKAQHRLNDELKSDFDNNIWYEVIDGQQRLTTIRILFSFLVKECLNGKSLKEKRNKSEFILEYETRKGTAEFLKNIHKSKENIDFYYISKAYEYIENWFKNKAQKDSVAIDDIGNDFLRSLTLTMDNKLKKNDDGVVQVIWYEIQDDENQIETFTRLNLGKIPLENSELIKALFLKKDGNISSEEQKQIEIANEWNIIENELQNQRLWNFITNDELKTSSRIELLFNIFYESLKKKISDDKNLSSETKQKFKKHIGNDKYSVFRFINDFFDETCQSYKEIYLSYFAEDSDEEKKTKANYLWNKIKEIFMAIKEWYEDPIYYHYIGFIIYCSKNTNAEIVSLYEDYKSLNKNEFKNRLKEKIKKSLGKISYDEESKRIDLNYANKDDKEKIKKLLLLFNLEYLIAQNSVENNENEEWFTKFPFDIFKNEKWDLEHIDSYTENGLKDFESQKEWLNISLRDLKNVFGNEHLRPIEKEIQNFEKNQAADKFERIKMMIQEFAGEDKDEETPEEIKNQVGNLTLLNASINREYKNALFVTKRRKIIEKDSSGIFIPLCTKNVFLKYFDLNGTSKTRWSFRDGDYKSYESKIVETLSEFLFPATQESLR